MDDEILDAKQLEDLTGTKQSTWRYWAHIGSGPASFKLGRRRVWKKSTVVAWIEDQERQATNSRAAGVA
jgi:predicted DNA-binding transcriptional regulator AlpA